MPSRRLCLPLAVACLATSSAHAASCDGGHWIDSVTGDGAVLVLEDGSVWGVEAGDQPDVATWTETTGVAVCDGFLMNEDDHETAEAEELRGASRIASRPVADPSKVTMEQAQAILAARQPDPAPAGDALGQTRAAYNPTYDPSPYRLDPNSPVIAAPLAAGRQPDGG